MNLNLILKFLSAHQPEIIFAEAFTILLLFIWLIVHSIGLRRISRRYFGLTRGVETKNLYELLEGHAKTVEKVQEEVEELRSFYKNLAFKVGHSLQKVGVVRFNAFDDVGGNLSFSLALLDEHYDGIVLTGLYGREDFRCYAKPIEEGKSPFPLSGEEKEAIEKAIKGTA